MPSHAIKIGNLYHAHDGAQEHLTVSYLKDEFPEISLKGDVEVDLSLIRIEEGIMLVVKKLNAVQVTLCSHCGKNLELPYDTQPSEWLFYETKPLDYDDENEFLFFNKREMDLDPTEPIRQELILNEKTLPRCTKACKTFKPKEEEGLKPLSGLKALLK